MSDIEIIKYLKRGYKLGYTSIGRYVDLTEHEIRGIVRRKGTLPEGKRAILLKILQMYEPSRNFAPEMGEQECRNSGPRDEPRGINYSTST
jgi:hypothetical protein